MGYLKQYKIMGKFFCLSIVLWLKLKRKLLYRATDYTAGAPWDAGTDANGAANA